MINIRQISNITKYGTQYTLENVRVVMEDQENGKQVTASKQVEVTYADVSSLWAAIGQHTIDVVQSGLI